jgi:hypothetical protein
MIVASTFWRSSAAWIALPTNSDQPSTNDPEQDGGKNLHAEFGGVLKRQF